MATSPNNAGIPVTAPLRIADLNNPNLKPWVVEALRKGNEEVLAGKLRWTSRANCMPAGVPQFLLYAGGAESLYMIQTPKEILMIHQANNETRHIYMDVPHSAHPKPSWYGESVGHYEGDTLVVDTIGTSEKSLADNFGTPHTAQLHTIERYRITNGGKTLEVNLHVEDPGTFTTPWDAIQRYRRVEPRVAEPPKRADDFLSAAGNAGPMLESSCAENPHGLFDAPGTLPIPEAGKPDF
jgi:hypothetical protein